MPLSRARLLLCLAIVGAALAACSGGGQPRDPALPTPPGVATVRVTTSPAPLPTATVPQRTPAATTVITARATTATAARIPAPSAATGATVAASPTADPWASLRRPLQLPALAPGGSCPRATVLGPPSGNVVGQAPIYTNVEEDGLLHIASSPQADGSFEMKIFWSSSPEYHGPVLIRGRQLDGADVMRFTNYETQTAPTTEQRLDTESGPREPGPRWRIGTFVRGVGCYAYQVDGRDFSFPIVVQIVQSKLP